MKISFEKLTQEIKEARSFILTTHKDGDADGLGSILAFHHSLKKMGKEVYSVCVDAISKRYDFMNHQEFINVYSDETNIPKVDCALVFDTNDSKLIEPLYSELKKKVKKIIFVDHHSALTQSSDDWFYIEENSASTGEICYMILEKMGKVPIDSKTAQALFTSIVFDTHFFRSRKNLSQTFYVCSQICKNIQMNEIYDDLFCQYNSADWDNFVYFLNKVQYEENKQIAFIECSQKEIDERKVRVNQILDCLDLYMKQKSVQVGFSLVEKQNGEFKVSLRSKKNVNVCEIAEKLGGGGHKRSAGATIKNKNEILPLIKKVLNS